MSLDATYHRTFLPDGPFEPATCHMGCHRDNNPTGRSNKLVPPEPLHLPPPNGRQPLRPLVPDDPFRTADMTTQPKVYYRTQKRRAAFMLANGELRSIFMVEKRDQQFAAVATPWEHEYSDLIKAGTGRFAPLVDQGYTLVGHVGTLPGDKMIVPKDSGISRFSRPLVDEFLAADEPIYVSLSVPDGWERFDHLYPMTIYTVVTGIDGEVIAGDATGGMPGAIATDGPIEYITLAVSVLKLGGAIVRGVVKAAVRTKLVSSVIKEISGPTKKVLERVLAKRAARKAAKAASPTYDPIAGITRQHHGVFVQAAKQEQLIIVVRHTNPKSIPLIEKGCPGKPKNLEFINTSPDTGIVMAKTALDVSKAQRLGYYVVTGDGKSAARFVKLGDKEVPEIITLKSPFWKVEKGQVIDPKLQKPIVGDYDLMGVINPKNPGQNMHLVVSNGELVTDVTSPIVQRAAKAVNDKLDMKRVLHGPQDGYSGFRKGASAYHPDGTVRHFATEGEVKGFYEGLGRQTRVGSHPRPAPGTPVDDEVARMRARKK